MSTEKITEPFPIEALYVPFQEILKNMPEKDASFKQLLTSASSSTASTHVPFVPLTENKPS